MKIIFFENGNTGAFDEKGEQVPEWQKSWLLLYFEFLKTVIGVRPEEHDFLLPNGKTVKPFLRDNGTFGW